MKLIITILSIFIFWDFGFCQPKEIEILNSDHTKILLQIPYNSKSKVKKEPVILEAEHKYQLNHDGKAKLELKVLFNNIEVAPEKDAERFIFRTTQTGKYIIVISSGEHFIGNVYLSLFTEESNNM
jgi:hypothetical protein